MQPFRLIPRRLRILTSQYACDNDLHTLIISVAHQANIGMITYDGTHPFIISKLDPASHNAISVIITIFMLNSFRVTRCGKSVQPHDRFAT
jgi:hypothetical protein